MSNLRAAVIGTGFIGPVHVEGLRRAGIEVVGVLGSNPDRSAQAANSMSIPRAYESLDQLLSDSNVSVVHVTSPNRFHHKQASKSLAAGKHVLCEKPLAMTSSESAELVQLAEKSGLAAGVNYNIRYYPLCIDAAERVRAGDVGDVFHVAGCYVQDWLFHPTDFNWRVMAEDGGELRAISDIGTHWLDLIQHIVGQNVVAVCADLSTVYPQRRRPLGGVETFSGKVAEAQASESIDITTEDYGCVMLKFASGAKGVLWVSQVTAGRKNCLRFEIAGSKQSLCWTSETPNEIEVGHRDTANQRLFRDPALVAERAAHSSSYPGGHNEGFGDTFKQLFRDFYASIESGQFKNAPSFPTFQEGHHEILTCESILQSHREQRWVTIGEIET